MKPDPGDDILARQSELGEAHATLARLRVENEELRRKVSCVGLGAPKVLPSLLGEGEKHGGSGYRTEAQLVRMDRELATLNSAIADLEIENAILRARPISARSANATMIERAFVGGAIVAASAVGALLTESVALFVLLLIIGVAGWGMVALIDAIKPNGTNQRNPPTLPPGGLPP